MNQADWIAIGIMLFGSVVVMAAWAIADARRARHMEQLRRRLEF